MERVALNRRWLYRRIITSNRAVSPALTRSTTSSSLISLAAALIDAVVDIVMAIPIRWSHHLYRVLSAKKVTSFFRVFEVCNRSLLTDSIYSGGKHNVNDRQQTQLSMVGAPDRSRRRRLSGRTGQILQPSHQLA